MRVFKRLFPILVLVLLTSVVLARPAGLSGVSYGLMVQVPKLQFCSGSSNPPDPRLDFGTVVRDTADEQSVRPGRSEMPSVLQEQVRLDLLVWVSLFTRSWVSLLLVPR